MGSLSGHSGLNLLAEIAGSNFTGSFGWLEFSLSRDLQQMEVEMLDIVKENVERKKS